MRTIAVALDRELRRCTVERKKNLTRLVQEAIDEGATTVEEIHKSIAALPLKVLEETDFLRGPAREFRRIQDHTIGAIYDVIRDINEQVGKLASDLLAESSHGRSSRPVERAGKRAAGSASH